ncbi:protein wntless homolog A-like [Dendronephthya gigantea]|uniref:protein wntless homolog A-like n=1 Tax=Dendronephthya gigantea TaxID=151771 RepID=UPI00106C9317|nr:protein wntless homolog A-like [Dendronephthya gigantea]
MAGVILETVSNKQLILFTLVLFGIQIMFFIIGGTLAPHPTSAMQHRATVCKDSKRGQGDEWFVRGENCQEIDLTHAGVTPDHIVFTVLIPHKGLDMSRWHQFLVGVMSLDITTKNKKRLDHPIVTMDMRLGARDKTDSSWKQLAKSREQRDHTCEQDEGGIWDCDEMPAFELGSVHYDNYLINIRLPYGKGYNEDFGQIYSVNIVEIHQNGGFTRMWFGLKTVLAPLLIAAVVWFRRRINRLARRPFLFETTIFWLGFTIAILDFPLEWFTLWIDMPFMLIISDIRQGIFYATLLSFWLIFAGEHVMDNTERNNLKMYRKEIVAIGIGALSLLIFDLSERGVQLSNPFHSIWSSESGKKLGMAFLIFAAICACLYFLFFLLMMLKVFWHISGKRSEFSRMAAGRRVAYEGAFYRFKFLLAFTIICAGLTIAFFIATNVNEAHWKFGEKGTIEISSAFIAGIYGLWNIYIFAILILYAPSSSAMGPPSTLELDDVADEDTNLSDTQRFITQPVNGETSLIYSIAGKGSIQ